MVQMYKEEAKLSLG